MDKLYGQAWQKKWVVLTETALYVSSKQGTPPKKAEQVLMLEDFSHCGVALAKDGGRSYMRLTAEDGTGHTFAQPSVEELGKWAEKITVLLEEVKKSLVVKLESKGKKWSTAKPDKQTERKERKLGKKEKKSRLDVDVEDLDETSSDSDRSWSSYAKSSSSAASVSSDSDE